MPDRHEDHGSQESTQIATVLMFSGDSQETIVEEAEEESIHDISSQGTVVAADSQETFVAGNDSQRTFVPDDDADTDHEATQVAYESPFRRR